MALPAELVEDFDRKIRQRGLAYFNRGDVEIIDATPGKIVARVRGSRLYTVRLTFNEDALDVSCTCPYAADWGAYCKHAWAGGVLQAQKQGLIQLDEEIDDEEDAGPRYRPTPIARAPVVAAKPPDPSWKKQLAQLKKKDQGHHPPPAAPFPDDKRIIYLIDVAQSLQSTDGLWLDLYTQKRTKSASWERPKLFQMEMRQWADAPDDADRMICQMLNGSQPVNSYNYYYNGASRRYVLPPTAYRTVLKSMCETNRCGLRTDPKPDGFTPLKWDDEGAWDYWLELTPSPGGKHVIVNGSLRRGDERMEITEPALMLRDGLVFAHDRVALLNHFGAWSLLQSQRQGKELKATVDELNEFLHELGALPDLPRIEVAPDFQIEVIEPKPIPRLAISRSKKQEYEGDQSLSAKLYFEYGDSILEATAGQVAMFDAASRRFVHRNRAFENAAYARLLAIGLRRSWSYELGADALTMNASNLHRVVLTLSGEGWHVQAEGSIYRRPGQVRMQVKGSGIDWFELEGGIEFDGKLVALPKLLAAMQSGQNMVTLDDGSIGLLPEAWLRKYAPLAGLGAETGDILRFEKNQVGFLDALLLEMPELTCDETVQLARKEVREFDRIDTVDAPEGFIGTLRPYQREGLGWLQFCQRFNFGGCLADDMGLGKTVQVLAMLEQRRQLQSGPSLVVVPRSLVFNWKAEAERFAPKLRLLDHSGIGRTRAADHFTGFDLIITTYGTLRRDASYFKDVTFDYVILDEAQAIKNNTTEAAKAARLLRGKHRLALTGTPIENHVGELWSLFEFLNPGMLGGVSVFRSLVGQEQNAQGRQLLSRALRPFILRRTKAQVASDLPEKLEQTIFCELEPPQRKLYDELREHYRMALMGSIQTVGLNKSKMQILEALLRLRQAACHPGLIDKKRAGESSAKLDALLDQLGEVLDEGHKVLVFSQFTSFLSLLRTRLDAEKITYEYLDGKTRDRQARVDRFQNDETCKLFLISLKAGGVGLNLTAADYVFLLDPWWNPAVEAQAIDRTHRIGQTRRVFAYRLIARDTVEEKVLQLQQSKRDLADAIITADNSLISKLGKEDLELLLS